MVLMAPVHDCTDPLLLGLCGRCCVAIQGLCGREELLISEVGSKREKRRGWDPTIPFEGTTSMT
jgi:hypothetical protein